MKLGEGTQLIEQIRILTSDISRNLQEIDGRLMMIQRDIAQNETPDRAKIAKDIEDIRFRLGALEKEDQEEMEDAEILKKMIEKLNDLIEETIG